MTTTMMMMMMMMMINVAFGDEKAAL